MFLIMFNTRHALPLRSRRILSPRTGRGESAGQPRNIGNSWPHTRLFHERGQTQCRTWTRFVRVQEQSKSVFCPHPRIWQQTVRIHELATTFTEHSRETAADIQCPQSVHRRRFSSPANRPRTGTGRALQQATNCPRHRISVSFMSPTSFPVHIQLIPAYVLV